MLGDQVYMARVTPTVEDIADKSKWEFYAGGHGADAKWVTGDVSAAKPLVDWCVNATHISVRFAICRRVGFSDFAVTAAALQSTLCVLVLVLTES